MSDIELAMSHYAAAARAAHEDGKTGHAAGIAAVWSLARGCAYDDAARRVREGRMCAGCGHRDPIDHSGVAGEPEATAKKGSENVQDAAPIEFPSPTPDQGSASNVAGGVTVPDEAVEAAKTDRAVNAFFDAYGLANYEAVQAGLSGWTREAAAIRGGLDAAAPLIAAQALRSAAGPLHRGLAGLCHPTECPGCALVERADELERGGDR